MFATAIVFALAQSLIFFIYAAGYSFGAFLVAEGRNSYDQIFRSVHIQAYKESCNNKPMYGYILPNLSPSPNLYKVQSVYNNNVAS